jgi:uncharacterized protein (TIGR02600 family)
MPTGIKITEAEFSRASSIWGGPWQTLLFTPYPVSRTSSGMKFDEGAIKHPGFGSVRTSKSNPVASKYQPPFIKPPDHLLLDLFTMPVVEPYAISEPLSTAGKVNLNYQIAPFTYIKRTTGLHGILKSVQMMGIEQSDAAKSRAKRYDINPDVGSDDGSQLDAGGKGTLFGFHEKFEDGDIFRSASQICEIPLVPKGAGVDYSTISSFWGKMQRTGDNVREIPYGHIYPRVTTKSNTFTVHMRVQSLQRSPGTPATQWNEKTGRVAGEYRGSTTMERYIDASDPSLPNFANVQPNRDTENMDNLDRHYRFRIISTKAFVR